MTIDEAIEKLRSDAIIDKYNMCGYSMKQHEQIAEWLEKLKYIENIILKWNADWYNDEDTGIPDDEILETIFNVCTDNGFDILIDEDYIKGKKDGYNKAINDYMNKLCDHCMQQTNECYKLECPFCTDGCDIVNIAERLKEGGVDAGSI